MKVIFSRKGFDSGYGRCPSPIFPDGRLVSLPIPSRDNPHKMGDLCFSGMNLGEVADQLSAGQVDNTTTVHLDPDLEQTTVLRRPGWRPSLGQLSSAQTHLSNNGVAEGDIFLFFGWFRDVEKIAGRWRYVRTAANKHVIFGWLQIGEILDIARQRDLALARYPWLIGHPHLSERSDYLDSRKNNTIYLANEQCSMTSGLAGGGTFLHYRENLCLTWPGHSRTYWRLPLWMQPIGGRSPMTYHPISRWSVNDDHVLLRSAAKGQEFVFDTEPYAEARAWVKSILQGEA